VPERVGNVAHERGAAQRLGLANAQHEVPDEPFTSYQELVRLHKPDNHPEHERYEKLKSQPRKRW
jgi:hypothetical protein